jgi:hypothetical protein
LSQDISSFFDLQIHTLVASQPWYREGGEAIRHFAPLLPSSLTVTQLRLANILRPVRRQLHHAGIIVFFFVGQSEQQQ